MESQEDIDELARAIYREKVERARRQDPTEKLIDGLRMFESALALTKAGVAEEIGSNDEELVMEAVCERFARVRRARERGLYRPIEERS